MAMIAALASPAAAGGVDLYGNTRYRSMILELPDGLGGTRESPAVRLVGDFSAAQEGFWGLGMRTLRYQWALVGAYAGTPYESWSAAKSLKVAEATLDWDMSPAWFLEAGKKRMKIGTGYFRRPSDIFSPDPDALKFRVGEELDRTREGLVGAGLLHYASWGSLSLFASPRLPWDDSSAVARYAFSPQELWQGFLRGTAKLGRSDFDLTLQASADSAGVFSSAVGFNAVTLAAENTELHLDALIQDTQDRLHVLSDGRTLANVAQRPTVSCLLGLSQTFDAHWGLIAEYLYNGLGLSGDDYFRALDYLDALTRQGRFGEVQAFRDAYGPMNLSSHYLMGRVSFTEGDLFLAEALGIGNLQDGGGYTSLRLGFSPAGWIRLRGEAGTNFGGEPLESCGLVETWHVEFGLELFY